jgi:hypothetical protein
VGKARHPAAQSHLRRSHASQGALHQGQPLSRHGL